MPGIDRSTIVTIVGISAVAALLAVAHFMAPKCKTILEEEPQAERSESYEGEVTCNADCQVFFSKPFVTDNQADNRKTQEQRDAYTLEQLDLCAQERMAHWTAYLGWFTALGTILLFLTLREAFKGTKAAETAAAASVSSANVAATTVESFKVTERAWLNVIGHDIRMITNSEVWDGEKLHKIKNSVSFGLIWKNDGRTPARRTQLFMWHKLVPFADKDPPPFDFADDLDSTGTVSPGQTPHSQSRVLFDDELVKFRNREIKIAIYGRATYCDIFDVTIRRQTEHCAFGIYAGEKVDARTGFKEINIAWSLAGPQNDAT